MDRYGICYFRRHILPLNDVRSCNLGCVPILDLGVQSEQLLVSNNHTAAHDVPLLVDGATLRLAQICAGIGCCHGG